MVGGAQEGFESKTHVLRPPSRGADLLTMQAFNVDRVGSATQGSVGPARVIE